MELAFLYVQLHNAHGSVGLLVRVLVDMGVPIVVGRESMKASNAWARIVFKSVRFKIHLAIQLLISEIRTGSTNRTNNDPCSGRVSR